MNMQTQALPIQVTNANAAPQRANASQPADGAQFSQALSREMEQRQHSPAPASATPAKQPAAPAKADQAKPATASADADDEKDDAVEAVAANPVADMLALVASFNQPATAPVADPAAAAAQAAAAAALKGSEGPAVGALKLDVKAAAVTGDAGVTIKGHNIEGGGFAIKGLDASAKDVDLALPRVKPDAGSLTAQPSDGADVRKAAVELAPAAVKADATTMRARESVIDVAAIKEPAASAPVVAPVQQASLAMAQAVNGAPTDRIAARVGTPGWDNQVGQKIVWMVTGKEQSATLTLNPPDMGPMQVVLSVTNDQASVTFSAAQPEVRQALENAMPKLREMMGENGIALGNASVNAGSPEQRQAQQGEQSRNQGGGNRFGGAGSDNAGTASAPRVTRLGTGTGLVDTFA